MDQGSCQDLARLPKEIEVRSKGVTVTRGGRQREMIPTTDGMRFVDAPIHEKKKDEL